MEKTFYVKSIKISGYKKKLANHTEQTYPQLSMDKKFDFQLIVTVTDSTRNAFWVVLILLMILKYKTAKTECIYLYLHK